MKLLDILVRDLKEWPEFNCGMVFDSITQDGDGMLNTTDEGCEPEWDYSRNWWNVASSTFLEPELILEVAEDCQTAIITKEQWEAAKMEQNQELTPCQNRGYKEGDVFEVIGGDRFVSGERVVLLHDDGTEMPEFACIYDQGLWHYEYLSNVKKIELSERNVLVEELQTQTKELVDLANSMKEPGPIEWRNRIREINLQMNQLQEERESLLNKLEAEGFVLIEAVNSSLDKVEAKRTTTTVEDMSDWRNWKEGDFIELIQDEYGIPAGSVCQVLELEDDDYDGGLPARVSTRDGSEWPHIHNMKWHSRPTKQTI